MICARAASQAACRQPVLNPWRPVTRYPRHHDCLSCRKRRVRDDAAWRVDPDQARDVMRHPRRVGCEDRTLIDDPAGAGVGFTDLLEHLHVGRQIDLGPAQGPWKRQLEQPGVGQRLKERAVATPGRPRSDRRRIGSWGPAFVRRRAAIESQRRSSVCVVPLTFEHARLSKPEEETTVAPPALSKKFNSFSTPDRSQCPSLRRNEIEIDIIRTSRILSGQNCCSRPEMLASVFDRG